jgi:hypothetical protein
MTDININRIIVVLSDNDLHLKLMCIELIRILYKEVDDVDLFYERFAEQFNVTTDTIQ